MRLYYTGAPAHRKTQGNPTVSLGGYISSTPVPNGVVEAILPNISQSDLAKGGRFVVLLALRNVGDASKEGVKIWFENLDDSLFEIQIGVVLPNLDESNNPIFEAVTSNRSLPVGIDFSSVPITEQTAIELQGAVAPGQYVGVWIKQTVTEDAMETYGTCDALHEAFVDPESSNAKEEFPFSLKFSWD